jgi:hypothetical protein
LNEDDPKAVSSTSPRAHAEVCPCPAVRTHGAHSLDGIRTRGDVHPLLALASSLHQLVVTGPPDFMPDAEHIDVPYVPHGPNVQALLQQNRTELGANPIRMVRVVRRQAAEHIDTQFEAIGRLARDTDIRAASLRERSRADCTSV